MGGFGSGREPWTTPPPLVDEHLSLDVLALARARGLVPGRPYNWRWPSGAQIWVNPLGNGAVADQMQMAFVVTGDGDRRDVVEVVQLVHAPSHIGGARTWFQCPGCGKRAVLLYFRNRAFRCRRCHGLVYRSTRQNKPDRLRAKARRIRKRLGGTGAIGDKFPGKPKGMHRLTYKRLALECLRAEAEAWSAFERRIERRRRRGW